MTDSLLDRTEQEACHEADEDQIQDDLDHDHQASPVGCRDDVAEAHGAEGDDGE
jgi:hypothetical protein